ncbi:MAG: ChaN family lipoprotein [Thermodesulfovibrionales bacterium]|nr:ChaN family lipoprotein [Thermodesulfovibrionales bacterium]
MHYLITKGIMLNLEQALEALMGYNVIFFGEEHDSRVAHERELTLLAEFEGRDSSIVLALEMFERDVQDALNAYIEGTIPEDNFLKVARPWPNYRKDYRPLVELAKARGIPVIAANVPRRTAAAVAMADEISSDVAGKDSIYLPPNLHLDSEEYYERFVAMMKKMPDTAPMKGLNTEALYKAQVLKDAVMAYSLEPFLHHRIFFCCGRFHSEYHLGIPYQLRKTHPDLKVAVVVCAESVMGVPMKNRSRIADFIWIEE